MTKGLRRYYGQGHLHFITFSCFHRLAHLRSPHSRDVFVVALDEVCNRYLFALVGYVVMPEHAHVLASEPDRGTLSTVVQALKHRISQQLWRKPHLRQFASRQSFRSDALKHVPPHFWQDRFYDFKIWSHKNEDGKTSLHAPQSRQKGLGCRSWGLALE